MKWVKDVKGIYGVGVSAFRVVFFRRVPPRSLDRGPGPLSGLASALDINVSTQTSKTSHQIRNMFRTYLQYIG